MAAQVKAKNIDLRGNKAGELFARLRREILSGTRKPGSALPTAEELSLQHRMAMTTASTALTRLMHEGLISRVRGRGSFVAQRLPNQPKGTRMIDFVRVRHASHQGDRASDLTLVEELSRLSHNYGWTARWHHLLPEEATDVEGLADLLSESRGVIVLKRVPTDLVRLLHHRGVPAVAVNPVSGERLLNPGPFPAVVFDRVESARRAVEHLASCGHRTIGFIGTAGTPFTGLRMIGFCRAIQDHGLSLTPEWIREWSGQPLDASRQALRQVLTASNRPSAWCCGVESLAMTVEMLALEAGLRVPQDVAVVACDTVDPVLAVREAPVPITAVGPSIEEMCQRALEIIEQTEPGFDPKDNAMIPPVIVPVHLIVRQSCGAKKESDRTFHANPEHPKGGDDAAGE